MPLIRIEHSVVIDRPLDDVFAYLAAPWNMPEWQEAVLGSEPDRRPAHRTGYQGPCSAAIHGADCDAGDGNYGVQAK